MDTTTPPYGARFEDPHRQLKSGAELRPGHVIDWRPIRDEPVVLGRRREDVERNHGTDVRAFETVPLTTFVVVTADAPYTILPYYRPCAHCGDEFTSTLPATTSKWSALCHDCIRGEL